MLIARKRNRGALARPGRRDVHRAAKRAAAAATAGGLDVVRLCSGLLWVQCDGGRGGGGIDGFTELRPPPSTEPPVEAAGGTAAAAALEPVLASLQVRSTACAWLADDPVYPFQPDGITKQ